MIPNADEIVRLVLERTPSKRSIEDFIRRYMQYLDEHVVPELLRELEEEEARMLHDAERR